MELSHVWGQYWTSVQMPCGCEGGKEHRRVTASLAGCLAARRVLIYVSGLPDAHGLMHLAELCELVLLILARFFNLTRSS